MVASEQVWVCEEKNENEGPVLMSSVEMLSVEMGRREGKQPKQVKGAEVVELFF